MYVDSSKPGKLHQQPTCYVYVLRLRSTLLKLPCDSVRKVIGDAARMDRRSPPVSLGHNEPVHCRSLPLQLVLPEELKSVTAVSFVEQKYES